jgi:preprotein translocase subunit SecG
MILAQRERQEPLAPGNSRLDIRTENSHVRRNTSPKCLPVELMTTLLLIIQIMAAFSMIVLILLQRSEGGALGMGGGGGGFVTGRGAANLLTKTTAILAAVFFGTSLLLGVFSHRQAPKSAVGVPVREESAPSQAPQGENAPLPKITLPKQGTQTPPAQSPAPAAPAQPQLPQSQ